MNDPFNQYSTIKLAYSEEDYIVTSIRSQGGNVDSFFYYQGLRAPLRIYKVDYPDNVLNNDIFIPGPGKNEDIMLANQTKITELDSLVVTK
jgi:hypothetical protein